MVTRVFRQNKAWVRAALTVIAENVTLSELSQLINVTPDGGGVLRNEVAQLQFDADAPLCMWILRSALDPHALPDDHLDDLLTRAEPGREGLQQLIGSGAIAEIVVCVLGDDFAVPFSLAPATIRRIADSQFGLRVFFTGERRFTEYAASYAFDDLEG